MREDMIKQSDIEKLRRFSKGMSTKDEEMDVYSLFANNENNTEFENQLKREFEDYIADNPDEDYNLEYLLDRIYHSIHKDEKQKKLPTIKKIYRWYSVAAAVLLIPIFVLSVFWFLEHKKVKLFIAENNTVSTIYAPLGSRINFSLPDGTNGWLNSGSSLKYQLPFKNNRHIDISGEAWFDVAHDKKHPFEIKAGNTKVNVLGTKFNMSAYPEENYIEIVLEEGKVNFTAPKMSSGIEMKPNERLVYSADSININVTEPYKYSAWTDGKLVFRGDPMEEVARRIERWYNVEVEIADKQINNYIFRGTFQDDSYEEVIKYLCMTSPINYKIIERKELTNGILDKTKVILY